MSRSGERRQACSSRLTALDHRLSIVALDLSGVVDRGRKGGRSEANSLSCRSWSARWRSSSWRRAAAAGNVTCEGVLSGPVSGNVVVPKGAECSLEFADVSGNVTAQIDATMSRSGVDGRRQLHLQQLRALPISQLDGRRELPDQPQKQYSVITDSTIKGQPPDQRQPYRSGPVLHRHRTRSGGICRSTTTRVSRHHGQHDRGQPDVPEQRPCAGELRQHRQEHEGAVRGLISG